jgi:hypothetical protein
MTKKKITRDSRIFWVEKGLFFAKKYFHFMGENLGNKRKLSIKTEAIKIWAKQLKKLKIIIFKNWASERRAKTQVVHTPGLSYIAEGWVF